MPNTYNKEYYEAHKEQMKKSRDKYRKGSQEAIERTRQRNRDRYNQLPPEKKLLLLEKMRNRRKTKSTEYNQIQYRIDAKKRQLKRYQLELEKQENNEFMLRMKDTWDSNDFKYDDELNRRIREITAQIDKKNEEIATLYQEREKVDEK